MAPSTVTGRRCTTPLDPVRLQHLRSNICAIFLPIDNAEFNKIQDKMLHKTLRSGTTHTLREVTPHLHPSTLIFRVSLKWFATLSISVDSVCSFPVFLYLGGVPMLLFFYFELSRTCVFNLEQALSFLQLVRLLYHGNFSNNFLNH